MSKKKRWSASEKTRIVLELFNTSIGQAELCRKHNLAPTTLHQWKERFLEGGRQALSGGTNADKKYNKMARELKSCKNLIGELVIVNDGLKKTLESGKR